MGSWCCRFAARARTPCRRATREKSRRANPGCPVDPGASSEASPASRAAPGASPAARRRLERKTRSSPRSRTTARRGRPAATTLGSQRCRRYRTPVRHRPVSPRESSSDRLRDCKIGAPHAIEQSRSCGSAPLSRAAEPSFLARDARAAAMHGRSAPSNSSFAKETTASSGTSLVSGARRPKTTPFNPRHRRDANKNETAR